MSDINVLVVEDEEDIRDLIHFNLFKNGHKVLLADDGEKAKELIQNKVDLSFLILCYPKSA